ncbi:amidohydrolase family protein [Streptomyces sp. DASNCL29]|uniref:amidohydrolase family protein n=1 Tax=Streptomyces sp. DASNCL29 TaxID=2583819 RepID=UPI00110FBCE2|nr:amidohydrolase family protein [Streptomyces sp. DASNCL29]TMU98364.1 amidohydrolase [Streptomyces sp. DASNCL29]
MRRTVRHVIDTHHHVGTLSIGATEEQAAARTPHDPVGTHHAMLDRFGMTACAVMPGLQYERPHGIVNTREVNDAIAAYRDRSPRFLAALGTVEPLHGLALCREELDRMVGQLGLDGVVWHTRYQGVAVSDRRMHALIDEATARGLPCYVHMFAESNLEAPWMFADLARNHPEATIVALDGFSASTQIQYVMDLADRFDNILFDTAICFPLLRPLDAFVTRFGSERLMFGTDSYADPVSYNVPAVMEELLASAMDNEHLENIFWRTFCCLFPTAGEALQTPEASEEKT